MKESTQKPTHGSDAAPSAGNKALSILEVFFTSIIGATLRFAFLVVKVVLLLPWYAFLAYRNMLSTMPDTRGLFFLVIFLFGEAMLIYTYWFVIQKTMALF